MTIEEVNRICALLSTIAAELARANRLAYTQSLPAPNDVLVRAAYNPQRCFCPDDDSRETPRDHVRNCPVRVWAELEGRA